MMHAPAAGGWRALLAILALAGAVALPPAGCTKRLKKLATCTDKSAGFWTFRRIGYTEVRCCHVPAVRCAVRHVCHVRCAT